MPDYDVWDPTNDFTVAQVCCLWVEVDPVFSLDDQNCNNPEVVAIAQMFYSEIVSGRLPSTYIHMPVRGLEHKYEEATVSRDDLKELAERKGCKPKFLFPAARQPRSEAHDSEPSASREASASTRDKTIAHSEESDAQVFDPDRSGFPGRPGLAKHLIEQEFERRVAAGEVCDALDDEGRALLAWLKDNHPSAPQPTVKTIKNSIRAQYNRHKPKQRPPAQN